MKAQIKKIIESLLQFLPMWIYKRWFPRELTAFFYHAVSDESMPHVKHLYPPVSIKDFENALNFFKQNFNPVSYAEVHDHVVKGTSLPERAFHLSFDDGFGECYTVVRPLLLKYEIPCTFFVASDWIDNKTMFFRNKVSVCIESMRDLDKEARAIAFNSLSQYLEIPLNSLDEFEPWIKSRQHADEASIDKVCEILGINIATYLKERNVFLTEEQVRKMSEEGFTIGSHSRSHPKMAQISTEAMEAEIVESAKAVQKITGDDVVSFSFPFSATGVNRAVLADIRRRHSFLGLFFDTRGLQEDGNFMVNRIWGEKAEFSNLGGESNIPQLLKAAYRDLAMEKIRKLL